MDLTDHPKIVDDVRCGRAGWPGGSLSRTARVMPRQVWRMSDSTGRSNLTLDGEHAAILGRLAEREPFSASCSALGGGCLVLHRYPPEEDRVVVITIQDGRSSTFVR
jgi:hypothetical protein